MPIFQKALEKVFYHKAQAGSWKNLLLHSSLTLSLTSVLSYSFGLLRDKIFAFKFGASSSLDIYNAAFVVPDFLFAVLVSGALAAAFVPIFTRLDEKNRVNALAYTNQVLSFTLVFLGVSSLIFAIILPNVVHYLVPGFSQDQKELYILVTRTLLIAPFFFTLSNTFGNALLSTRDFLWYGLAPVFYNIGIVFGVLFLTSSFGVMGLVAGTVLGSAFHMLIRGQAMWRYGFRPRLILKMSPEIKETAFLMLPKMLQIGMWQLMLLWFIRLASQVDEGGVTIYNFAYNFQSVPVSLIGIAIALASFSELSHLAAHKDFKSFGDLVKKESIRIVLITSAAALVLALVSEPLVRILLGGGRFTSESVIATSLLIKVYAFSVPLESLMHLLARAHYALLNTLRPSLIHILAIFLAMVTSYILLPRVGLYAIPIGFSSGFLLQGILLSISLWQLLGKKRKSLLQFV
jgi:putative peptidoglycan lipid II flippase